MTNEFQNNSKKAATIKHPPLKHGVLKSNTPWSGPQVHLVGEGSVADVPLALMLRRSVIFMRIFGNM